MTKGGRVMLRTIVYVVAHYWPLGVLLGLGILDATYHRKHDR